MRSYVGVDRRISSRVGKVFNRAEEMVGVTAAARWGDNPLLFARRKRAPRNAARCAMHELSFPRGRQRRRGGEARRGEEKREKKAPRVVERGRGIRQRRSETQVRPGEGRSATTVAESREKSARSRELFPRNVASLATRSPYPSANVDRKMVAARRETDAVESPVEFFPAPRPRTRGFRLTRERARARPPVRSLASTRARRPRDSVSRISRLCHLPRADYRTRSRRE